MQSLPTPDATISGMPHSREAEEAVIGSVLINPDCYSEISALFKDSNDFYIHRLRFIWDAIESLVKKHEPVDILTLSNELESTSKLEEIGGTGYLVQLLNQSPTSLHAEAYAKIVAENRARRDLLYAANHIAKLAYSTEISTEKACADAVSTITDATITSRSNDIRFAPEIFSKVYDEVDRLSREPADILPGIKTGFVDLDNRYLSGGWKRGNLAYVGARPGEGKTAFLLSCLYDATYVQRRKAALFSLEMTAEENVERLISMEQEINGQAIETGKLHDYEWPKFVQAIENGSHAPFAIDDTPYLTPAMLRAKTLRLKAMWGLDLVLLDYVGLMEPDRYAENRNVELSNISRSLKNLARELNVPIVAAHQLSRDVEKRGSPEPQLSDLRDSGSLEQDGNIVAFLYTDRDTQNRNVSHFKVAKNRKGPVGTVDFLFRREYTRFYSLAKREFSA